MFLLEKSVPGRREFFHQGIDFARGDSHDDALDGSDLLFGDFLFPGHAKVVLDSWPALPGHCRRKANHRNGTSLQLS